MPDLNPVRLLSSRSRDGLKTVPYARIGCRARPSGRARAATPILGAPSAAVLRCDLRRDRLRPDAITLLLETQGAPMSMAAAPSIQPDSAPASRAQMVTARQHRDAGAGRHGAIENEVGQRAARVARNHDVGGRISTSSSAPATDQASG